MKIIYKIQIGFCIILIFLGFASIGFGYGYGTGYNDAENKIVYRLENAYQNGHQLNINNTVYRLVKSTGIQGLHKEFNQTMEIEDLNETILQETQK